ncbi:MAG: dihydroorotase [Rhodospirillaceae bacterium]|nr:dihydroorotase [Rhodospirillaceae bacterium]
MMPNKNLTHNAHLLCAASGLNGLGWVLSEQGVIRALGHGEAPADLLAQPDLAKVDGRGHYLIPGLVDALTLAWPWQVARPPEDAASFLAARQAGGIAVAAIAASPAQPIDDLASLQAALFNLNSNRDGNSPATTPLLINLTKGGGGQQLAELHRLLDAVPSGHIAGVVDLSANAASLGLLQRAWMQAGALGLTVHHLPLEASLAAGTEAIAGEMATRLGLAGLWPAAEAVTLARDFALLAAVLPTVPRLRYHAALVTTAGGVAAVRAAKAQGLPVTAATAPPYFLLNDLALSGKNGSDFDSAAKLFPPLASEGDRLAVVAGLADGTIDVIVSAHQPVSLDDKRQPFGLAAVGISALETLLPLSLSLHHQHGLPLPTLLAKLTDAPARLLGLDRGRLQIGCSADYRLLDLHRGWQIQSARLHSRCQSTPFDGALVQGMLVG